MPAWLPMPVFMSIGVTVVGILFSAMWNPGGAVFSLSSVSISCLLGGLSMWLWILQRTLEQQTVRPYVERPLPSEGTISNRDILSWFRQTMLCDKHERNYVIVWFVVYMVGFLLAVVCVNSGCLGSYAPLVYAFAIGFYVFSGVAKPTLLMCDR